jgi:hypothetical protein
MSRRWIVTAAAAGLLATALAGAAPTSATGEAKLHTKRLVSVDIREHFADFRHLTGAAVDRQAGHTVGYESFTGIFYPKRDRAKIWVTYALKGGSITTVEHINGAESRSSGAILRGTGKYKGITGTLTARQALHNERKSYIVLKYRFCSTACAPAPR